FRLLRSCAIAAMSDVVRAFSRQEQRECGAHQVADLVKRAGAGSAQERFQFGERQFNRIEIWTVGWEKAQLGSRLLDGEANFGLLVSRQVIEHDDITALERRD